LLIAGDADFLHTASIAAMLGEADKSNATLFI
jgi:hypothetical protein